MTETLLLVILGLVITVAIWGMRYFDTRSAGETFSPRTEAIIRYALMFVCALIAHALYNSFGNPLWYFAAVLANAFLLYGVSHFFDRLLLK
jgi:hypothetical protein